MIRILLYQPSHLRDILSFFLADVEGCCIAGSLDKHISVEKHLRLTQPNVVLLDIALEGGMELLLQIKKCDPSIKILVLTETSELSQVILSLKRGANGYLLSKKTPLPTLVESIKVVREGGFPMSPSLMGEVLRTLMPDSKVVIPPTESTKNKLTKRESEILQLLVNGLSYKGVSFHLNIAIDTVRSHIKRIYEKLEVNSKSEAVVKALKENVALML